MVGGRAGGQDRRDLSREIVVTLYPMREPHRMPLPTEYYDRVTRRRHLQRPGDLYMQARSCALVPDSCSVGSMCSWPLNLTSCGLPPPPWRREVERIDASRVLRDVFRNTLGEGAQNVVELADEAPAAPVAPPVAPVAPPAVPAAPAS